MALVYLTWWLMSPGVACFLLVNVLVAAIAVTSRSRSRRRAQHDDEGGRAASTRRRLCRSASSMVLDRLRSFCYYISPEAEELKQASGAPAAHDDRQLAVPEPAAVHATISTTVSGNDAEDETAAGAVKSVSSDDGNGTCALGQEGRHAREAMPSSPPPPPPAAAPAVAVVTSETATVAALVRESANEEPPATVSEFAKRKHRRRDHVYAVEGKAELNARAEQFIRRFRQELRLQRLDSMLSHNTTLSTGSGAPTSQYSSDTVVQ